MCALRFDPKLGIRKGVLFSVVVTYAVATLCTVSLAFGQTPANSEGATRRLNSLETIRSLAAQPKECSASRSLPGATSRDVGWAQARELGAHQRCARLALGGTLVQSDPKAVLGFYEARRASTKTGEHELWFAERLLRARALLRTDQTSRAFAEFSALQAQVAIADWHALAVHDFAVSAALVGRFDVAEACYRRLVSLLAWLPGAVRVSVLVEAASTLLHLAPARSQEAHSLLREVEREALGSDVEWTSATLRLVASEAREPAVEGAEIAPSPSRTWAAATLRLTAEDQRFFNALATYSHTGQWPSQSSDEQGITSALYLKFIARLRAPR